MAKLLVTYTVETEIDIVDYQLKEEEIELIAEEKSEELIGNSNNIIEWEWVTKPKPKEYQIRPPKEYWLDSPVGLVATNNLIVITKDFELDEDIILAKGWKHPEDISEKQRQYLDGLLLRIREPMYPHEGFFSRNYLSLKYVPGIEVFKLRDSDAGFIFINNVFSGILMPCEVLNKNGMNEIFRFDEKP